MCVCVCVHVCVVCMMCVVLVCVCVFRYLCMESRNPIDYYGYINDNMEDNRVNDIIHDIMK